MTELCLPISVEREEHLAPRINNETLNKYLLQVPGYTDVSIGDFAPTLDLGFFTPAFRALYQTEVEVNVLDEEEREEVGKIATGYEETFGRPSLAWEALLAQKGLAERGCVVYFDTTKENRGFWCSEIEVGNRRSVELNILDSQEEGNFSMITIHTHPKKVLPSPEDYWMLMDDGKGDQLVPGIVVLLPDFQILALATAGTPLLDRRAFDDYVSFWNKEDSVSQKKRIIFTNRKNNLIRMILETGTRSHDEMLQAAEEVGGELTVEVEERLERINSKIMGKYQEYIKRVHEVHNRSEENWFKYLHQSSNATLNACARSIQVKLYISKDMKNFSEFSA